MHRHSDFGCTIAHKGRCALADLRPALSLSRDLQNVIIDEENCLGKVRSSRNFDELETEDQRKLSYSAWEGALSKF
jgi:hypothetical protein